MGSLGFDAEQQRVDDWASLFGGRTTIEEAGFLRYWRWAERGSHQSVVYLDPFMLKVEQHTYPLLLCILKCLPWIARG